ncbi:hypothetical protein GCM10027570_45810 [Streptomonospora sediminis]
MGSALATSSSAASALTAAARELPGLYHLVAVIGGRVAVQGTASGMRMVYYCETGGEVAAANRQDLLAGLIGAKVDEGALALRMLAPLCHPLGERTLWRGVRPVPAGSRLEFAPGSAGRVHRWWSPPEPRLSSAAGAEAVREALTRSVRTHVRGRTRVLTDLSGGYDSTTLSALVHREAARGGPEQVAITYGNRSAFGTDEHWAGQVAALLPGLDHRKLPADTLPLFYADLRSARDPLDEPSAAAAHRSALRQLARIGRDHRADAYITGHGGDHLFTGMPSLARDLLGYRPVAGLRRIAAYRTLFCWPLARTLRQLGDLSPYRTWLARALDGPHRIDHRYPVLTWGTPPAVPPWLSEHGRRLIAAEFSAAAAENARPLAATRGRHAELDLIIQGAQLTRGFIDISADSGLAISAPFFDDRVIEAVLSVDIAQRVDPWSYKPLLAASMRGLVPDVLFERTTKDEGSEECQTGLYRYAPDLRRIWRESRLARRGLVDAARLERVCRRPDTPELDGGAIDTTLGCELWLRSHE